MFDAWSAPVVITINCELPETTSDNNAASSDKAAQKGELWEGDDWENLDD